MIWLVQFVVTTILIVQSWAARLPEVPLVVMLSALLIVVVSTTMKATGLVVASDAQTQACKVTTLTTKAAHGATWATFTVTVQQVVA